MKTTSSDMVVEGRKLTVSNLDKVLYPATGFTKADVIRYYLDIGPVLLPHLQDRALTMKRYPDGVGKSFFYEKNCPSHRPKWLQTASAPAKAGRVRFCLANDLPSLAWMANLADLELHVSLARAPALQRPTALVFDLDPGSGADVLDCAQVALWIREKLAASNLVALIKTSGSKGLQLYVPLNTVTTFERTKAAARALATAVQADHPDHVVTNLRRALRTKKVLIDWSQNEAHKTTISVYSLRATEKPQVSTPLHWSEVEKFRQAGDARVFRFCPDAVLERVRSESDLFKPVLQLKQKL